MTQRWISRGLLRRTPLRCPSVLICPLLTPQSTHSRLQEFFGEYFEKQLLVIRREQADYYDDVYSIFDVESTARRSVILCHCCPFTPVISCVVQAVALAIHLSRNSHPQKAWSRRVNVVCMTPLQRLLSVRYRCIESEGEFMLKKDGHDLRNSDRAPPDCFAGYSCTQAGLVATCFSTVAPRCGCCFVRGSARSAPE